MLIVGAFGGLASQMNQYAFVLWLRRFHPDADVRFVDACEWMKAFGHYGYELQRVFGIATDEVEFRVVRRLANFYPGCGLRAKVWNAMHQLRDKVIGPRKTQILIQSLASPDDPRLATLDLSRDWLFWGNSNEWVIHAVGDELRRFFVFPPLEGEANARLVEHIKRVESVSVHVRRGDYVKFGYPLLEKDYYSSAFARIERQIPHPTYFVFSDDQSTAKALLGTGSSIVYVEANKGESSYRDMQLMSLCKHNIVANSGFSRMAAFLNPNPRKIVVDPNAQSF